MNDRLEQPNLCDLFAAAISMGLAASRSNPLQPDVAAKFCYERADAMLIERARRAAAASKSKVPA